jgi:hypothetical protein
MARARHRRAWRSLLLVGIVLLAACSSDGGEDASAPTGGSSPTSSHTKAQPTGSTASDDQAPDLSTMRFQSKSGNIHCESTSSSSLLCVIDSGLVPEPSADFCPVDWIGVLIQSGEFAGPSCSGDPGISREPATVLEYGATWAVGDMSCLDESTGLTCQDQSGNGFTLAMAGWSLLGKENAARAAFPELRRMVRAQARADLSGQVARVPKPELREGDDCGELQGALVQLELVDGSPAIYSACFVTGTWYITAGPLRSA